ncbi:MAG TPA: hypothetical protein GX715_07945 [Armatimonadetes bacterium]|nr:hypothetical protein [Armatimonadota bacterium]
MGRPRRYATHAERQAAYRIRQGQAEVAAKTDLEVRAERLRAAMEDAAGAGVPLARELHGGSAAIDIGNLALWFEHQAALHRKSAP